jgi:hypothetical protein
VLKVTHGPARRIGRVNDARILLEDDPESGLRPTFSQSTRATMVA